MHHSSMMMPLRDNSNSNDSIFAVEFDNKHLIIKRFYNNFDRSLKSLNKQKNSYSNLLSHINPVPIHDIQVSDDYIEVVMPYVYGVIGQEYASITTRDIAQHLSENISLYIHSLMNFSTDVLVNKNVFNEKIDQIIANRVQGKYQVFIDDFLVRLNQITTGISLPVGPCHGDLTLSNIIYENSGQLKLIDFLHTYLESPIQDVCKIDQDYRFGWSFRYLEPALKLKGSIFTNHTAPKAVMQLRAAYPKGYELLMYLTLLRIIPYVKDDVTDVWLHHSLIKFSGEL